MDEMVIENDNGVLILQCMSVDYVPTIAFGVEDYNEWCKKLLLQKVTNQVPIYAPSLPSGFLQSGSSVVKRECGRTIMTLRGVL